MRKQSLSEGIFEQLRDQILKGTLAPGSRLTPEAALATAAGVSRLTVREAIRRLEQAGLVGVSQGTAPMILDFRENSGPDLLPHMLFGADGGVDTAVARSILEMRDLMVPEIARLAALRGGPAAAQRLELALERLREVTAQPAEFLLRTLKFDSVLVEACDSIAYQLVSNPLRRILEAVAGFLGPVLPDGSEELRQREELARGGRERFGPGRGHLPIDPRGWNGQDSRRPGRAGPRSGCGFHFTVRCCPPLPRRRFLSAAFAFPERRPRPVPGLDQVEPSTQEGR